jgi:hypothetical protein
MENGVEWYIKLKKKAAQQKIISTLALDIKRVAEKMSN